jgi:putative proteasome-type protease
VRGEAPRSFLIYPQGNPLSSTEDSPFLQLGEYKYGRPILDRGIVYQSTSLKSAAKYALLSFDATMRSNVTVGPPIEIAALSQRQLSARLLQALMAGDRELETIHALWERCGSGICGSSRQVEDLPVTAVGVQRHASVVDGIGDVLAEIVVVSRPV